MHLKGNDSWKPPFNCRFAQNFVLIRDYACFSCNDKVLRQGGEAEPSEGCSYLTRVAPVVIKNDLSLK